MLETCAETPAARLRKCAILLPAILALVVLWTHYHLPGVTADGVSYLQIARNILLGKGLGWQALWVPPLHSILIAGSSYLTGTHDLLAAAGMIAPLMFLGLVIAVYLLALDLFDLRTALVASFFAALFPQLIFIAFSPEAEITYAFFLTLSLLLVTRSITRESRGYAIAAGISFALAWMARSEGFAIMVFVFAGVTVLQGPRFYRSTIFRYCLLSTLFFTLTASPYLLFLQKHYGSVVISPKASYVMIWMKGRTYNDNDKGETGNDELWGLTPDGKKLRWQEPKGMTDLVEYLMSHPQKSLSVYLHDLGTEVPGRIPYNSGMERYPQTYPIYFALAALLAACTAWGGGYPREKRAILLAPFLMLLVLPIFTEGWWKYLIPYLPLLLVLAARGFTAGSAIIADKLFPRDAARMRTVLLAVVAAVIGVRFLLALHPFSLQPATPASIAPPVDTSDRQQLAIEARKAGQWGARRFGPGKNYMTDGWNKMAYYLDGLWTAFPVADYLATLAYAKRNGVDYVVIERVGEQSRIEPEFAPGLQLEERYRSDSYPYAVDFYRVVRK